MRKTTGFLVIASALFLWPYAAMAEQAVPQAVPQAAVTLDLQGIREGSGERIQQALSSLEGVSLVKVDEAKGIALVVYDPVKARVEDFAKAVEQAGSLAKFADARFSCPHCGAKYSKEGRCIACDVSLSPVSEG